MPSQEDLERLQREEWAKSQDPIPAALTAKIEELTAKIREKEHEPCRQRIDALEAEVASLTDAYIHYHDRCLTLERDLEQRTREVEEERTCRSRYARRALLYTDTVRGEQCSRDDLWALSTTELNEIDALEGRLRRVVLAANAVRCSLWFQLRSEGEAKELDDALSELADRAHEQCEHTHCIAACEKGEHLIKCESCGKEWKEPCPYPPGTLHA